MENEFWEYLERLIEINTIEIDRPKGSAHPRFPDLIYPLDYGYLKDTTSIDGGGLDVWLGSQSGARLEGIISTIDLNKRDLEIKVIIGCSEA
jgi:inorganic pyrophosphatase